MAADLDRDEEKGTEGKVGVEVGEMRIRCCEIWVYFSRREAPLSLSLYIYSHSLFLLLGCLASLLAELPAWRYG
jgi:hypothetical protein